MRRVRAGWAFLGWLLLAGATASVGLDTDSGERSLGEAVRLLDGGAYGDAAAIARSVLADLEARGQGDSIESAKCLEVAATALLRLGKIDSDARTMAERALEIRSRSQGPGHPESAASMVVLADVLRGLREVDAARDLYERALEVLRGAPGDTSRDVANALNGTAGLLYNAGDIAGSWPLYRRVLEIREAVLPAGHPDVGDALNNLGNVHRNLGEIDAARASYERAIAIFERVFGSDHVKVASALNNLALTCKASGDWSGARTASERALAIYEQVLGPHHPWVAGMLNNLANLADKLGDEDVALGLLERSLAIRERALGPDHPDVAQALNNIGDLLRRRGSHAAARPLLERSLAIREKALGPDHPHVARTLSCLGELLVDAGDPEGGAALIKRGLSIFEAALGPENREVAASLIDLARVELARGRAAPAAALAGRAVSILAAVVGEDHPDWAEAALTLARAAAASGNRALAMDMSLRSEDAARSHLQLTAPLLAEREALSYAGVRARGRDLALDLLVDGNPSPGDRRRVWEATVAARGVVHEALLARAAAVEEARDPAVAELVAALHRATDQLARHLVAPPPGPAEEVRRQIAEDHRRCEAAERELAAVSLAAGGRIARRRLAQPQIAAALPPGAALVSYVRYERVASGRGEPAYLAFVVKSGEPAPRVIALGPAARVDDLVGVWFAEAAADPARAGRTPGEALLAYRRAGRSLRRAVWDPLGLALGDASLILVVPDGALHLLSFATLPLGRTGYLLEAGPAIHRLGAERELLLLTPGSPSGRGFLALGAARLDALAAVAAASATDRPGPLGGRSFGPLPGAAREVEEIARTWAAAAAPGTGEVTLLTGAQASESALKRLAPGRRAVHIATHGFYTEASPAGPTSRGVGGLTGASSLPAATLLEGARGLTGLLLTPDPAGPANAEDGVVTAPEISLLDLSGVEWTVLSACDTGRGALHASEGVLGLERAFRAAGSRTVIVSLWAADDQATREWMTALYRARLNLGETTAEAVRSAALDVLHRRRGALTSHPFAWGAFVATGDWR